MKSHWHFIFVAEPINEAIRKMRQYVEIDYVENLNSPGSVVGHFEDYSGLIQACNFWNKEDVEKIFAETGRVPKTCIVLRGSSPDFEKKDSIVRNFFEIIKNDCNICNQKKGEQI